MLLGTHNSGTGSSLIWWQKPFSFIINPFSKCQSRTIAQQLADGVKVFNLQVAYVGGKWRFTHGLAIYSEDLFEVLSLMKLCASVRQPIYFQLYLDKALGSKSKNKFIELVNHIKKEYCKSYFIMLTAWVEGTNEYIYKNDKKISLLEQYWTKTWADCFAYKILDKLPLPKYHAKKFNTTYKESCNKEYLMLDYYQL